MALITNRIIQELENRCRDRYIPFAVVFELTYTCNLSCKHCYVVKERRRELSFDTIKGILHQLIEAGTFFICWTGGEIFTRNDCLDILGYAKNKGFFQVILTNGTLITPKVADVLQEIKPRGIEISLLGATAKTHDGITGVPGSLGKTVKAIELLVKKGIFVITKTTLMRLNVQEYRQIKILSKSLGAVPKISSGVVPRSDGAIYPQQYQITWGDREQFLNGEILDESFLTYFENDDVSNLTCKAGKAVASISPYGDVSPCILLPARLGNLNKKSFKEIWYNPDNDILNELRSLKEKDLTKCSSCELSSVCVRCSGAAYMENKSLKAPFYAACEEARWRACHLPEKISKK